MELPACGYSTLMLDDSDHAGKRCLRIAAAGDIHCSEAHREAVMESVAALRGRAGEQPQVRAVDDASGTCQGRVRSLRHDGYQKDGGTSGTTEDRQLNTVNVAGGDQLGEVPVAA